MADDANTSVCAMEFDGAGKAPIGLTSAASPIRPKPPTGDTAAAHDPTSDARTLRPPAPDAEPSGARAGDSSGSVPRLDETPLGIPGVPEVGILENVSSARHLKSLAQSSSQNELPVFRRVEFEGGRPVHIDDVADPGRPRKSEAPPEHASSKPPPMQHAPVSASQLVNLNSMVIEDVNRPASKRPPATGSTIVRRQVLLALGMFLAGVGTTLLLVYLLKG